MEVYFLNKLLFTIFFDMICFNECLRLMLAI